MTDVAIALLLSLACIVAAAAFVRYTRRRAAASFRDVAPLLSPEFMALRRETDAVFRRAADAEAESCEREWLN